MALRAIKLGLLILSTIFLAMLAYGCGHVTGYRSNNGVELRLVAAHLVIIQDSRPAEAHSSFLLPGFYRKPYNMHGFPFILIGPPPAPGVNVTQIPLWLCLTATTLSWVTLRQLLRGRKWGAEKGTGANAI